MLCRHHPNDDVATVFANALEIGNASKIDEMRRGRESQFHHRNKTVPARNGAGVFAQAAEQADRILDRRWTMIGKGPRYHRHTSPDAPTGRLLQPTRGP